MKNKWYVYVLSVFLALLFFTQYIIPSVAEVAETIGSIDKYVSDIKIFSSKEECESAGYVFVEGNLNQGNQNEQKDGKWNSLSGNGDTNIAGYSGDSCYLGYKITTDENQAITDLKMLQMGIGYRTDYNYAEFLEEQMDLESDAQNLYTAAIEFTENYTTSPLGYCAYEILNDYYVPAEFTKSHEDTDFGKYIVSSDFDTNFIKSFLVRSTGTGKSLFVNQLAVGVADVNVNDTWATRISKTATVSLASGKAKLSTKKANSYDQLYSERAKYIVTSVKTFAQTVSDAIAYYNTHGNSFADVPEMVAKSQGDEAYEAYCQKCLLEGYADEDCYPAYYVVYKYLSGFSVTGNLNLGDYLISIKNIDETNKTDMRKLYPLVEAMTVGQIIMTKYVGVLSMASYLNNTKEAAEKCIMESCDLFDELLDVIIEEQYASDSNYYNKTEEEKKELRTQLKKSKKLSIYDGVNMDFYNSNVCVTDALIRANTTSGDLSEFIGDTEAAALERADLEQKRNLCVTVAFCVDLGIQFAIMVGGMIGAHFGITLSQTYLITRALSGFCWAYSQVWVWLPILILTMAALFVVMIVNSYDKHKAWSTVEDSEATLAFTDAPKQIFSIEHPRQKVNGKYKEITVISDYTAVTCNSNGKIADINCDFGKRWNALYYTKDKRAGSPIKVSDLGSVFTVQYGDYTTPTGYTPLCIMGSDTVSNLNSYSANEGNAIYLYYQTEQSIEDAKNQTDPNNGVSVTTDKYLTDIKLAYSNNETTAKRKITDNGYTLIDNNLTPNQYYHLDENLTRVYTYIGYKTSSDVSLAITDIRVVNSYDADQIAFGNANYANAGTTVGGDSLYYTCMKSAGTPITGELFVYDNINDAPDGYEPVNLLSGGPAFNFSRSATKSYYLSSFSIDTFGNKYVYFKPTVMYGSASGTKYVSGLFALRSTGDESWWNKTELLDNFKKTLGNDINIIGSLNYQTTYHREESFDESDYLYAGTPGYTAYAWLAYSTTYNPYRAIYDIKIYQGSNTLEGLFPTISGVNGSYASAESYCLGKVQFSTGLYMDLLSDESNYDFPNKQRVNILPYHSISKCIGANTNLDTDNDDFVYYDAVKNYGEVQPVGTEYVTNCLKGLYVLGNTSADVTNAKPIKPEQLVLSLDGKLSEKNSDYMPVVSFMNQNAEAPFAVDNIVMIDLSDANETRTTKYFSFTEDAVQKLDYTYEDGLHYLYVINDGSGNTELINGTKEKYISSIYVGSANFSNDAASQSVTDDVARISAIAGSADEIIYDNIAMSSEQVWYQHTNVKTFTLNWFKNRSICIAENVARAAYIGVSRTNDASKAIYDIVRLNVSGLAKIPKTITVDGFIYNSSSGTVYDANGAYVFYYTNNSSAGSGSPITELSVSNVPMENGKLAFRSVKYAADGKTLEFTACTTASDKYLIATVDETVRNSSSEYCYTDLAVGGGATEAEAMAELLAKGYQFLINADLNYNSRTGFVYIGYKRQTYSSLKQNGDEDSAITDILFTVGEEYEEVKIINGIEYIGDPTSLNKGTNGAAIYMYTTTDRNVATTEAENVTLYQEYIGYSTVTQYNFRSKPNAINNIRIYVGDWIPESNELQRWSEVRDVYGYKANLNEDVWNSNAEDTILYMYVTRLDNSIKG